MKTLLDKFNTAVPLTDPGLLTLNDQLHAAHIACSALLAILVLDPKVSGYLLAHSPKVYEQAQIALQAFGYPDLNVLREKLSLP